MCQWIEVVYGSVDGEYGSVCGGIKMCIILYDVGVGVISNARRFECC